MINSKTGGFLAVLYKLLIMIPMMGSATIGIATKSGIPKTPTVRSQGREWYFIPMKKAATRRAFAKAITTNPTIIIDPINESVLVSPRKLRLISIIVKRVSNNSTRVYGFLFVSTTSSELDLFTSIVTLTIIILLH
jgi:hypothetical protein